MSGRTVCTAVVGTHMRPAGGPDQVAGLGQGR